MEGYEVINILLEYHEDLAQSLTKVDTEKKQELVDQMFIAHIKGKAIKEVLKKVIETIEDEGLKRDAVNRIEEHFTALESSRLWGRRLNI